MVLENEAYNRLIQNGVHPSAQRLAIMEYLMNNRIHPTVEQVYRGLCGKIPTLSRTTVYNTLRLLSEHQAAQMITIDDHHVCYDGITEPHVHFFCRKCGRVIDMPDEAAPRIGKPRSIDGHLVDEMQLYYKGVCAECASHTADEKTN